MADFSKTASKKSSFIGTVKFALVKQKETYKGKTYIKWKGSFSDGDKAYLIDMGEMKKIYKLEKGKNSGKDAYFGNAAAFHVDSDRRR